MAKSAQRIWFVTGCSTGLGRAIAQAVIESGDSIAVTARSQAQVADLQAMAPKQVLSLSLDVTSEDSIDTAVKAALDRFGRIDILVNNAGAGLVGAIEECQVADLRRVYDTNVFGTLAVTRRILPTMRSQRAGHIIFITSVGAMRGSASVGIYGSSKAALDVIAEALRGEVSPLGLKVSTVMPGLFRTDFRSRGIARAETVIPDYDATVGQVRRGLENPYPDSAGDPAQVGQAILKLVDHDGPPPLRLALGADCVDGVRKKIAALESELAEWESVSLAYGGQSGSLSMYEKSPPVR
jgi:NAD(P)-dependent dehydrogenase (short-subunit alcohol dehydrogenase family)